MQTFCSLDGQVIPSVRKTAAQVQHRCHYSFSFNANRGVHRWAVVVYFYEAQELLDWITLEEETARPVVGANPHEWQQTSDFPQFFSLFVRNSVSEQIKAVTETTVGDVRSKHSLFLPAQWKLNFLRVGCLIDSYGTVVLITLEPLVLMPGLPPASHLHKAEPGAAGFYCACKSVAEIIRHERHLRWPIGCGWLCRLDFI